MGPAIVAGGLESDPPVTGLAGGGGADEHGLDFGLVFGAVGLDAGVEGLDGGEVGGAVGADGEGIKHGYVEYCPGPAGVVR